jgi:P22_AR N-terminal domain
MNNQLQTVQFAGTDLFIINQAGKPFVPMRTIVENMGMDWKSQYDKLKSRFSTCVVEITTQLPNDTQTRAVTCLPLAKIAGWLYSVSPNKVAPEIREKVIQYQNECDTALFDYWTKGAAVKPASTLASPYITPAQQRAIQEAVSAYVHKHQSSYGTVYGGIKSQFKVATYAQLAPSQYNDCLVWLEAAPAPAAPQALPVPSCASIRTLPIENLETAANGGWITPKVMRELRERNREPIADLIRQVEAMGGDVRSARTSMLGFYSFHDGVESLSGVLGTLSHTFKTQGHRVH